MEEGVERVEVAATDGARAEAYAHGAHVVSWRPASGEERLFLSARSAFETGVAIRGGIPVIFPQFASLGPLLKHGFARIMDWETVRCGRTTSGKGEAHFRLTSSPVTRELWPHDFEATVVASVGGMSLTVALSVLNRGESGFSFTAALHTYLLVDDVRDVTISGLGGAAYRDSAAGGGEGRQTEPDLRVAGELDRIYFDVAGSIEVRDRVRRTRVAMSGFTDAVLWNPGADRAAALADLEPGGWLRMLCVEAAAIGQPVTLGPGERWTGQSTLTAL
jgi:glucose-6-phosphate 1-epimerase